MNTPRSLRDGSLMALKGHFKQLKPNKDLSFLFIEKIIQKCYNKIKRSDFLKKWKKNLEDLYR